MREQDIREYCYCNETDEPITYSRKYSQDMVDSIRKRDYSDVRKNYILFKEHIDKMKERGIEYDKRLENLTERIYSDFVNDSGRD